jgi:transaldolase
MSEKYYGPLHESVATTVTELWNDSCCAAELEQSMKWGAVGATTNPVIVGEVLKKELPMWEGRIRELIAEMPDATDDDVAWRLIEEMGKRGAALLLPVFERECGLKGRLSIQVNGKYYRDAARMLEQAKRFNALAPNMQVKMPATRAGIQAIEEATAEGVNINATVSFTVPQALAVAEAVERGLKRREAAGYDVSQMTPVCTLMIGRLDDWLKVVADRENITVTPGYIDWAGIAVLKKAYKIYNERGYRTKLLTAAFRNHLHWSETIGGNIIMTMPFIWQQRYNASDVPPVSRMGNPVDPAILQCLYGKFADFRRAYDEDGMTAAEFDSYGATVRTLRSFIASYDALVSLIRDRMLPDPDKK